MPLWYCHLYYIIISLFHAPLNMPKKYPDRHRRFLCNAILCPKNEWWCPICLPEGIAYRRCNQRGMSSSCCSWYRPVLNQHFRSHSFSSPESQPLLMLMEHPWLQFIGEGPYTLPPIAHKNKNEKQNKQLMKMAKPHVHVHVYSVMMYKVKCKIIQCHAVELLRSD